MSRFNISKNIVKKSKKSLFRLIFSRLGIITVMLLIQFFILFAVFFRFVDLIPHVYGGGIAISIIAVVYLANCQMSPNAKITWLILMIATPVFGSLLLVYTRSDLGHRALSKRFGSLTARYKNKIKGTPNASSRLRERSPAIANLADYVGRSGCHPVFENTDAVYFPSGEDKHRALLEELEKAKSFIFLEYFIIDEGEMWSSVLDVLTRKSAEGVDVRLIYDGSCEFSTLPGSFHKRMRKLGIKCKVFAPVTPFVSTHYNYRDHRKIAVIDGESAFSGGINLADEYINKVEKYGHWKDSGIMLRGEGVKSFTLMFLQMWNLDERDREIDTFLDITPPRTDARGFVLPFADCPVDSDKTGERVYMDILNRATDHVRIMSPYLVLDSEMETAIRFAAERGVEVTLILPGIPDKKGAWALAKTHYKALLDSGVRVYEYTPGFVHSKVFEADSREAVVGTINLDFRSLYHHFECAVYMAFTPCIADIEKDFANTLSRCRRVTYESVKKEKLIVKIRGIILKLIAPLI